MKIIFLDIDGVLNSRRYDRLRSATDGNIDVSRLPLLKSIIDSTGAKIVLSSTWRAHWTPEPLLCDPIGQELNRLFADYGIAIYDKTPAISASDRAMEIRSWLQASPMPIESFVILDDIWGGWGDLSPRLVRTSPMIGRGLEEKQVQEAIWLLS